MTQRLDRNGIPILDPPKQANKLPKVCDHSWVQLNRQIVDTDWMTEIDTYEVTERCYICHQMRTREDTN